MLVERRIEEPRIKGQGGQNHTLQGLVGTGIDDLAKYRIVQHLRECANPIDAGSISASLGLHPVDLVTEDLESLTSNGILVKEGEDPPLYTLSCHPSLHLTLQRLSSSVSLEESEGVLRALAEASLARARARARGNGGEGRK